MRTVWAQANLNKKTGDKKKKHGYSDDSLGYNIALRNTIYKIQDK